MHTDGRRGIPPTLGRTFRHKCLGKSVNVLIAFTLCFSVLNVKVSNKKVLYEEFTRATELIIHHFVLSLSKTPSCLFFKTQRFGDWILSPSSGKTYSVVPNR
jgi:hypothetical protein